MRWIKKPFLRVLFCIGAVIFSIAITFGAIIATLSCWDAINNKIESRVAKNIIDPKAEAYIAAQYPGNDFIVEDAYHVFYSNFYRVDVRSTSSPDTHFHLMFNPHTHELEIDSYEIRVVDRYNTRERIEQEYHDLVEQSLSELTYLHSLETDFTSYRENSSDDGFYSPNGLDSSTLILDHDYDVAAMGTDYGYLEITVIEDAKNIDGKRALEILTEVDAQLAKHGVGYTLVEITLKNSETSFRELSIYGITPEDLHCDDPLGRLRQLWEDQTKNS